MEIRETSLLFPETEGEGPVTASTTLSFPRRVRRVGAGIAGYTARFEDNEDHHLGRLEVEVSASVGDLRGDSGGGEFGEWVTSFCARLFGWRGASNRAGRPLNLP